MDSNNYNVDLEIGDTVEQNNGNGAYIRYTVTGFVLHLDMILVKVTDGKLEKLLRPNHLYKCI